VTFTDVL